ncbi:hypothetical protein [Cuniculiplasma divulgatum]|uniref:Uncharacterized protein n=1 Tax=Cuniculiplasma divulgatum TaxID=1673428 RepID=A0A1N5TM54_9ARCH|nr:hypothetical protein [Cuniculiplasma divulgatum]SIM49138.1 hypothetical protein CSP5_0610 [Cuniculiplasma divulgatum]
MNNPEHRLLWPKDPPDITPEYMAKEFGRTVRARVWILLEESWHLSNMAVSPMKSYNAYDLWEVCKDLITSKKDRFKSINEALKDLMESNEIIKIPGKYEERYQFNPHGPLVFRFNEGDIQRKESKTDKAIRELYNTLFNTNITESDILKDPDELINQDILSQRAIGHYHEFAFAVAQMARLFENPITQGSSMEKLQNGFYGPSVAISYKPGGWKDKLKKDELKDSRILFVH